MEAPKGMILTVAAVASRASRPATTEEIIANFISTDEGGISGSQSVYKRAVLLEQSWNEVGRFAGRWCSRSRWWVDYILSAQVQCVVR
jgi:hypothetical protein